MKIEIEGKTYYDIPELMRILGVGRKSLYTWIQKGKLKPYKVGRRYFVSGKALQEFIESNPL